jgi:hypothetical protein
MAATPATSTVAKPTCTVSIARPPIGPAPPMNTPLASMPAKVAASSQWAARSTRLNRAR